MAQTDNRFGIKPESDFSAHEKLTLLRSQIECLAARHAALHATDNPAMSNELKQSVIDIEKAIKNQNYAAFRKADYRLHLTILKMSEIPFIEQAWQPVWDGLNSLHASSFQECWPDLHVLITEHKHLVDAICLSDAGAAENDMRSHIQAVWYRYQQMQQSASEDRSVQRAAAYVAFRLGSEIRLQDVAKQIAHTSPGNLSRQFRDHFGMSFQKYVQTMRMHKAASLLSNTKLSVSDIAQRVSYQDASRFGQHFKRQYGLTPLKYRQNSPDNPGQHLNHHLTQSLHADFR
ncbi:MAG: helix-turn-helix domain-containing protein [Phycisphaeraceae bacterium JB051]